MPGLRRDELAVLAGLSPDYYSRVEQGRQSNVSVEVLLASWSDDPAPARAGADDRR